MWVSFRAPLALLLWFTSVITAAAAPADTDTLKLIAAELPYPELEFGISVALGASDPVLLTSQDPRALLAAADERLAANPDDPQAHFDRGLALDLLRNTRATEEYTRAAELWQTRAETDPANVDAQLGLARALVQAGDWSRAQPLVQRLATDHPEQWWPHFALGQRTAAALFGLLGMGYLGSIKPPDPNDPEAVAQWAKHFPQEHVAAMLEAIRKAPEDPEPLRSLAKRLADEALAHVEKAAQAAPGEIGPALVRFLIHWQLGMLERARDGQAALGLYDTASDELLALAQAHPEVPRLRLFANFQHVMAAMVRARVTSFLGVWDTLMPQDRVQLAEDEAATRQLLQTGSDRSSDIYELVALYLLLRGRLDEAIQTLRESTEYEPSSRERWEVYIGVLTQTEDLPRIQEALEKSLEHTDQGALRCALAKVHQKQGNVVRAEAQLQAAIALNDDHATFARLMLGLLRLKSGRPQEAIEPLETAAAAWQEDGLCETALAVALALSSREAEALPHIERALKLSPNERLTTHAAAIIRRSQSGGTSK